MQLSQKFFAEITGIRLDAAGDHAAPVDRRHHPRIPFDRRARIFPLMEGASENGTAVLIRDISVTGIGFLYAEPISMGDEFVLRLFTHDDKPIDLQCAARRCEMSGTCQSQFAVGATFELVLNVPLSEAIAPESEVVEPDTEMVDQPAPPTIEQRYDIQCVTSRQIRPIIRETRLDRWLARPVIKKITRFLTLILWPAIFVCNRIRALIPDREESRIRSRLSASKSSKKRRAKKQVAPSAVLPPPTIAQPAPEIDASLMKMLHPALFHDAEPKEQPPPSTALPTPVDPSRRSIFSTARIEPAELPAATQSIKAMVAAPVPAIEPAPIEPAADPAPPVVFPEPTIEATATNAAKPIHLEEHLAPQTQETEPEPALISHEEAPPVPEQPQRQPVDAFELPAKPRPPVAHPRQMRRRPRTSYNR